MPGTRAGTGQPITFRCAKCKKRGREAARGTRWVVTRVVRGDIAKPVHQRVSRRVLVAYRCLDCGHEGRSGHFTVIEAARKAAVHGRLPGMPGICPSSAGQVSGT